MPEAFIKMNHILPTGIPQKGRHLLEGQILTVFVCKSSASELQNAILPSYPVSMFIQSLPKIRKIVLRIAWNIYTHKRDILMVQDTCKPDCGKFPKPKLMKDLVLCLR